MLIRWNTFVHFLVLYSQSDVTPTRMSLHFVPMHSRKIRVVMNRVICKSAYRARPLTRRDSTHRNIRETYMVCLEANVVNIEDKCASFAIKFSSRLGAPASPHRFASGPPSPPVF